MKGELILHVVHMYGTRMIKSGIYGLCRGNNLGGMMRGPEPLKVSPLGKGATERFDTLEPWLLSWQGDTLTPLYSMGWFEEEKKRRQSILYPLAGRYGNCYRITVRGSSQEAL